MAKLRYVTSRDVARPTAAPPSATRHTVQSLRVLYETEPEIAAALLPRPLVPAASPLVFVQVASVTMHLPPQGPHEEPRPLHVGAATVGIACSHEGRDGYYVLTMVMDGEPVVVTGREKFGEPKKLGDARLVVDGDRIRAPVTRRGITFLELHGRLPSEPSVVDAPRRFTEHLFTYKALPACRPDERNHGCDGDVLLVLLTWERDYASVRRVDEGRVVLRESPYDPLVDVPCKRLVRMELAEGGSRTSGEVLRAVPAEWLAPFLVQRYDDPQPGIEIALASEMREDA